MSETPKQRAQAQNAAIEAADAALAAAGLPTWTEALETLDEVASKDPLVPAGFAARAKAKRLVESACGTPLSIYMQRFGRAYRPGKHPRELALEVCAAATCEDVALDHFRIRAPADQLETVHAHLEANRVRAAVIEYLPLEPNK